MVKNRPAGEAGQVVKQALLAKRRGGEAGRGGETALLAKQAWW